jgi:sorbose reductase
MAGDAMHGGNFAHDSTSAPPGDDVLPYFSLKGRTAIIAGAAAGIGLAVSQALAEAGANVAMWYHSNQQAIDRAKDIEDKYKVQCL